MDNFYVNGQLIPALLINLINKGEWKTPSQESIRRIAPFFKEELEFLVTLRSMEFNTKTDYSEFEHFFQLDSRIDERANNLPWLDSSKAVIIAINKIPGEDIAIALDYRKSADNPRVVGTNWYSQEEPKGGRWELISRNFHNFAVSIGLI